MMKASDGVSNGYNVLSVKKLFGDGSATAYAVEIMYGGAVHMFTLSSDLVRGVHIIYRVMRGGREVRCSEDELKANGMHILEGSARKIAGRNVSLALFLGRCLEGVRDRFRIRELLASGGSLEGAASET